MSRIGIERQGLALTLSTSATLVAVQVLAILVLGPPAPALATLFAFAPVAIAVALFIGFVLRMSRYRGPRGRNAAAATTGEHVRTAGIGAALGAVAGGVGIMVSPAIADAAVFVLLFQAAAGAAIAAGAGRVAQRLPTRWDGALQQRRRGSFASLCLAILFLAQIARFSAFMVNPSLMWGSVFPPRTDDMLHMCFAAYVEAADLHRQGDPNLYHADHYPMFHPPAAQEQTLTVDGLRPFLQDAYHYPPTFIIVVRAFMLISNDFLVFRALWFGIQFFLFAAIALSVVRFIGGREGAVAGVVGMLVMVSIPTMFNLQWGQLHLSTVAMAVWALLAIHRGHDKRGALILATAVWAKMFPALIVPYLLFSRRYRALGWTIAFGFLWLAVGVILLGIQPYWNFVTYFLPRILSGVAFEWVEEVLVIARNQSPAGLVWKLEVLGVPGMTDQVMRLANWGYLAVFIFLCHRGALLARAHSENRLYIAQMSLAIVILAYLRTPLAPAAYSLFANIWLLSLYAPVTRKPLAIGAMAITWLLINGVPPLSNPAAEIVSSIVVQFAGYLYVLRVFFMRADGPSEPETRPPAGH